jgi:hypothetical protein
MPRKTKAAQTQDLDIVEIQDGIEVEPIGSGYPIEQTNDAEDVEIGSQDSHKKELAKQAQIRRREAKKEEKYGTLTEKRLAALAKGREIARINREKKKLEFEEKLKSQMKLEMEQMLQRSSGAKNATESTNSKKNKDKHVKHKQPEPELSDSEEDQEMVQKEVRQKEVKQKEVKQKDASQELNPPKAKHGVLLKEKEFQPVRVITKQKFQEEAKKIVETSKKKMPIFKDEEKHSAKGKGRVIDFFKPHKVVYVSESEESD